MTIQPAYVLVAAAAASLCFGSAGSFVLHTPSNAHFDGCTFSSSLSSSPPSTCTCILYATPEQNKSNENSRRSLLKSVVSSSLTFASAVSSAANALDMDAFASSQLAADSPKSKDMSKDEALCKFGAPGRYFSTVFK